MSQTFAYYYIFGCFIVMCFIFGYWFRLERENYKNQRKKLFDNIKEEKKLMKKFKGYWPKSLLNKGDKMPLEEASNAFNRLLEEELDLDEQYSQSVINNTIEDFKNAKVCTNLAMNLLKNAGVDMSHYENHINNMYDGIVNKLKKAKAK